MRMNMRESDASSRRIGSGYDLGRLWLGVGQGTDMVGLRLGGRGFVLGLLRFELVLVLVLVSGIGYWVLGIGYSGLVWRTADQIGPLIKIVTIMAKNPPPVRVERPPKWQS